MPKTAVQLTGVLHESSVVWFCYTMVLSLVLCIGAGSVCQTKLMIN